METDKIAEIKKVIEKIRPYIQRDGGDVEFVAFDEGCVSVRMSGACHDCLMLDDTIKEGVEMILTDEIADVTSVKVVE